MSEFKLFRYPMLYINDVILYETATKVTIIGIIVTEIGIK